MDYNIVDLLEFALDHHGLVVTGREKSRIHLNGAYEIEIEKGNILKLSQGGNVIGPFDEVYDLCQFILKDMENNE